MAQFCILHETYQRLDDKFKAKLLANYHKTLELRKNKRMQHVKGVVQQLYTAGLYDEADKYIDTIPSFFMTPQDDDGISQDSDAS